MVGGSVLITSYFLIDLKMMITRRSDYYETSFWMNGFFDLHTDILFICWRDLVTKEDSIDTEE